MGRKKWFLTIICIGFGCYFLFSSFRIQTHYKLPLFVKYVSASDSFELKRGDLLVRPNWIWLPGSWSVPDGRNFGHIAFVTEGAKGKSVEEVLEKSKVIEAVFFDQKTRRFQFNTKNQINESNAIISFGKRFENIRYRLRLDLRESQTDSIIDFLRNQLDGGYNIFAFKKLLPLNEREKSVLFSKKNSNWNCTSLVWEAVYLGAGIDIDSNKGMLVFPSDIIVSPLFDHPGSRIRF